ncbi:hypothetical protein BSKO_10214 [Bryopsis sp. KO-2023]|nr:hypothetical protein BSKO_10214 [Bryopsis sp. KO-2023]
MPSRRTQPLPPLNARAEACVLRQEIKTLQTRYNRLESEFNSMTTQANAFIERVEKFLRARTLPVKTKKKPSRVRIWLSALCCIPLPEEEEDDETEWLLGTAELRTAAPFSFASSASSQAAA